MSRTLHKPMRSPWSAAGSVGPNQVWVEQSLEPSSYRVSATRVVVALATFVYPIALLWVLKVAISPTWAYQGYEWDPPSDLLFTAFTFLVAWIPSWLLPLKATKPSTVILWFMYLVAYVPCQIIPTFTGNLEESQALRLQLMVLVGLVLLIVANRIPASRLPRLPISSKGFGFGLVAIVLFGYAAIYSGYGLPTELPDFYDAHDVRADFSEQTTETGQIPYLMLSWMQKVINPFLMGYGLVKRRVGITLVGTLGQLYLYGLAGNKSVLLSGIMVVAILLCLTGKGKRFGALLSFGAVTLVLISVWMDYILNTFWYSSLFIRRLILTPGLLTGWFYDFFSTHPKGMQFGPLLRDFFDYPYDLQIPFLIGREYFGRAEVGANANLWADGYANFGFFGIIAGSLLLGLLLWLFDSLSIDREYYTCMILAANCAWSLTNSALFVTVVTHGVGLSLIVLFFLPAIRDSNGPERAVVDERPVLSSSTVN